MAIISMFRDDWVSVPRVILESPNLGFTAKGIVGFIFSLSKNCSMKTSLLYTAFPEGEPNVRKGLEELEREGFIRRNEDGDWLFEDL